MSYGSTCEYDVTPEAALVALAAHEGPLLIDFDETLYLRNSTEDFIDCARPMWLAALLLRVLDVLKPWRLTGRDTQDNWRTIIVCIALPWTLWRWRARVASLAKQHVNAELMTTLKARTNEPVVVTVGFVSIVKPLLAAMGYAHLPLIASRMRSFADRRDGKLKMAVRKLGHAAVAQSLVVTDSTADVELLRACKTPLRTRWPQASYRRALGDAYLPGEYVARIKHPGERYVFRAILLSDFAYWVLSSIGLSANRYAHFGGLFLLLLSFWAIYERGYVDNDLVASQHESDPKLTAAFSTELISTPPIQPWIWATISGAAGIAMLHPSQNAFAIHFVAWMALLVVIYTCFRSYNRLNKQTRIWLYPFLQIGRIAAFTVVVRIEPAGIAALSAHLFSRWLPYLIYRLRPSSDWPEARIGLVRLISFILVSLITVASIGPAALITWCALGLLLWTVFLARVDLHEVFESARRVDVSSETRDDRASSNSWIMDPQNRAQPGEVAGQ